ncbi:zinc ribbon domain-containing protein, partial [Pseudomonas aeruginosa]
NAATARFCQGCGGALAPLRCIACSADLAAGAKFCGACGAPQQ